MLDDKSQSPKGKHHKFYLLYGSWGVGHEGRWMRSMKGTGIIRKWWRAEESPTWLRD